MQNLATNSDGNSASIGGTQTGAIIPLAGSGGFPMSRDPVWSSTTRAEPPVEVYSYLAGGPSQWYLAAGALTNTVFTATLDKYAGGQCVSCASKAPALSGNDGTITITFTSPTTATADLPGGRHIQIQRCFQ